MASCFALRKFGKLLQITTWLHRVAACLGNASVLRCLSYVLAPATTLRHRGAVCLGNASVLSCLHCVLAAIHAADPLPKPLVCTT